MPYHCPSCNDEAVGIKVTTNIDGKTLTLGFYDRKKLIYHRFWVKEEKHKRLVSDSYGTPSEVVEGLKDKKCRWFKVHSLDIDGMLRCRLTAFEFFSIGIMVDEPGYEEQVHIPLNRFKVIAEMKAPQRVLDERDEKPLPKCIKCQKEYSILAEDNGVCSHCLKTCWSHCFICNPVVEHERKIKKFI